ncbi:hypothetical protein [Arthrobacter sp. UYCu712]|uniref:hypothetical protein n=1 Tax=Arthrobacter sp. UYCu712 TaxID=3156340 RepID=UPI003390ADDA
MIERTRGRLAAAAVNNRHGEDPEKVDAAAARARELKRKGINASDIGKMLGRWLSIKFVGCTVQQRSSGLVRLRKICVPSAES